MISYDVIIIGAGAAGLFCAAEAGKRKKRVLVIEHEEKVGKKFLSQAVADAILQICMHRPKIIFHKIRTFVNPLLPDILSMILLG